METIHSLLDFFSYSGSPVACVEPGESGLDALIGVNEIETQTRLEWQSMTLVSSLPKLGNESRLYKIVVLKHKLLDIFIYSAVK